MLRLEDQLICRCRAISTQVFKRKVVLFGEECTNFRIKLSRPLSLCRQIGQHNCEAWWLGGKFGVFRPEGFRFESHSSRHEGTLGKSFTHSCLKRFGVLTPTHRNRIRKL